MGRQIELYFNEDDEKEFLNLHQFEEVVFLKFREMIAPKYELYNDIKKTAWIETRNTQTFICRKSDLEILEYQSVFTSGRNLFYIDSDCSPVIEFSRSGYIPDTNNLIGGRLWYEHKYWAKDQDGNDVLKEKSKELEKLYESLARWIRKYCKRLPDGRYIGPGAMKLHNQGARL